MKDELIPIHHAIVRSRLRIEINPKKIDRWFKGSYTTGLHVRKTQQIRLWIDEHTTGRFYLANDIIFKLKFG